MSIAIKVENLSKAYQLGEIGTGSLSRDFERWLAKVRGKEDPFLKVGETNDRTVKGTSDVVWSLKDINLEIKQGEAVGIIGRNGAGKSTLLKLLSRITSPTTGKVKAKGRIASLLEVGTGFHPELSGRENVFLNGAILGMRKKEITRKFDEILDFAGVERYIDTPVKRYSSGMYVRLAFAVAAHLQSEILIVDEVLAVGDAEFQKKCLGKMNDVNKAGGRTVLFVSHNMAAIKQLCNKGILLINGEVKHEGTPFDTIEQYLMAYRKVGIQSKYLKPEPAGTDIELVEAEVTNEFLQPQNVFSIFEDIYIQLSISCKSLVPNLYGYVAVKNSNEEVVIESDTNDYLPNSLEGLQPGLNTFVIKISKNVLSFGEYYFYLSFASTFSNKFLVDVPGDILKFTVEDTDTKRGTNRKAQTSHLLKWELQKCYQINQF